MTLQSVSYATLELVLKLAIEEHLALLSATTGGINET